MALVTLPLIGNLAGMDSVAYGTWAGLSVHDAASAVAAGFAMDDTAGQVATVVKMTRVLFLVPLLLAITFAVRRRASTPGTEGTCVSQLLRVVPWFVVGFVALAALNGVGALGSAAPY